jgi:hypothetical protein
MVTFARDTSNAGKKSGKGAIKRLAKSRRGKLEGKLHSAQKSGRSCIDRVRDHGLMRIAGQFWRRGLLANAMAEAIKPKHTGDSCR